MRALMATGLAVLSLGHTSAMAKRPPSILDMPMASQVNIGQSILSAMPQHLLVPGPRSIKFVDGVAPGTPPGVMSPAQTDIQNGIIYTTQPLEKFDRAHEVGHVFDGQILTDGDRAAFQRLMHAPAGAWNQGSAADTGGGPSEWFADYYAAAAVNMDPNHESLGGYAKIGPKRLKRFEQALDRLGRQQGLQPYK